MQLAFRFGRAAAGLVQTPRRVAIDLENPVIAGREDEPWARLEQPARRCRHLSSWRSGDGEVWGAGFVDLTDHDHQSAAQALYRELLRVTGRLALQRIWNFVPRINAHDGELENYQAFCKGRHLAFEHHFGRADVRRMPAASAVGTAGNMLCAVFVAGRAAVRHLENPEQTPAYRYPDRYGPKAPSFARASLVPRGAGTRLYVSGTASIRGSETLHQGDVSAQCALALDNLDLVARAAGLPGLNAGTAGRRAFRVYLRHPEDWTRIRPLLEHRLCRPDDRYAVLHAGICRRALLVELEACVDTDSQLGDES